MCCGGHLEARGSVDMVIAMMETCEKERHRIEIQKQIAKFIADGGRIDRVDHTANHSHAQPTKRSRRDQVDYLKRFGADRRQG